MMMMVMMMMMMRRPFTDMGPIDGTPGDKECVIVLSVGDGRGGISITAGSVSIQRYPISAGTSHHHHHHHHHHQRQRPHLAGRQGEEEATAQPIARAPNNVQLPKPNQPKHGKVRHDKQGNLPRAR
jgi:hypothetical protein